MHPRPLPLTLVTVSIKGASAFGVVGICEIFGILAIDRNHFFPLPPHFQEPSFLIPQYKRSPIPMAMVATSCLSEGNRPSRESFWVAYQRQWFLIPCGRPVSVPGHGRWQPARGRRWRSRRRAGRALGRDESVNGPAGDSKSMTGTSPRCNAVVQVSKVRDLKASAAVTRTGTEA